MSAKSVIKTNLPHQDYVNVTINNTQKKTVIDLTITHININKTIKINNNAEKKNIIHNRIKTKGITNDKIKKKTTVEVKNTCRECSAKFIRFKNHAGYWVTVCPRRCKTKLC